MSKFSTKMRPDAWMDWTYVEQDEDERHGPILKVRQNDHSIHLTHTLADELVKIIGEWRASPS